MKKRIIALGLLWCLSAVMLQAARVDTVLVRSAAMNKDVKVVYVLPDKAIGKQACPVVYLLHGYGGNARSWVQLKPELPQMADEKGIIFVCPDGKNSWYWDSPENPAYRYETFVTSELVKYTDGNYATIPDRKARAISGLSMGGHGALWQILFCRISWFLERPLQEDILVMLSLWQITRYLMPFTVMMTDLP